jgi:hypothetical protein
LTVEVSCDKVLFGGFHDLLDFAWPYFLSDDSELEGCYFHMKSGHHDVAKISRIKTASSKVREAMWS